MVKLVLSFVALFFSINCLALESIAKGVTDDMSDIERLYHVATRCDALFLSQTNRIRSQISSLGDISDAADEVKSNVKKASKSLDELMAHLVKLHWAALKLGEKKGEEESQVNFRVVKLSAQYDDHRTIAYVAPSGFTSIEEEDIRMCGAFLKELDK